MVVLVPETRRNVDLSWNQIRLDGIVTGFACRAPAQELALYREALAAAGR
jgi:hypothetical protein